MILFIAIQCQTPSDIQHGFYVLANNDTMYGSTVEYSCKPGFKMTGPKTITCMANGQYDSLAPSCAGKNLTI